MAKLYKSLTAASKQLDAMSKARLADTAPTTPDSTKKEMADATTNPGKISDAQVNAIVAIHKQYVVNEDLGPSLLACFT